MEHKQFSPLKIGILIVALAYFLFTLHATFVTSWIGEWEPLLEPLRSWILVTDVVAFVFLVFRFLAGILAAIGAVLYVSRKLSQSATTKIVRAILILEGLYWVGLLPSGIWGLVPASGSGFSMSLLISTGIPCTVAITITISLFVLAWKLGANKPQKAAIKWAALAGFFYILEFWLNNTGMWIITVMQDGFNFVLASPHYLFSFIVTVAGMLALVIYTAYFAKKSMKAITIEQVSLRSIGVILAALGTYFLWNYLTWIFFGGWNEWYAWVLGHNLDLWLLALPLAGIPLLLSERELKEKALSRFQYLIVGVGAVFVAIFLAAYLAGIPTTTVYHSEAIIRYTLFVLGAALLELIVGAVTVAALSKAKS